MLLSICGRTPPQCAASNTCHAHIFATLPQFLHQTLSVEVVTVNVNGAAAYSVRFHNFPSGGSFQYQWELGYTTMTTQLGCTANTPCYGQQEMFADNWGYAPLQARYNSAQPYRIDRNILDNPQYQNRRYLRAYLTRMLKAFWSISHHRR